VGALIVYGGLYANRKWKNAPIPMLPFAIAASVPWFVTALQEAGILDMLRPDDVPVQNQVPDQTTEGMGYRYAAMQGGLQPGRIPGGGYAGQSTMQGALSPGVIPGGVPRMGRAIAA